MAEFPVTEQARIRRAPSRGHYDTETIYRILDEALVCHVGFVQDGRPFVIPTLFARLDDSLILHGAPASRMLQHLAAGHPVCVAVTLADGLVLARSAYHHSMNYRSVVVFGRGRVLEGGPEKLRAVRALTEHIVPGRWEEARLPNPRELEATSVVAVRIEDASAKIRTGPPVDEEEDYALSVWAGVLPLQHQALAPIGDPRLPADIAVPGYVTHYDRTRRS